MMERHNAQATSECVSSAQLLWESVVDTRLGGMWIYPPLFRATPRNPMFFGLSKSSLMDLLLRGVLEGKLGVR